MRPGDERMHEVLGGIDRFLVEKARSRQKEQSQRVRWLSLRLRVKSGGRCVGETERSLTQRRQAAKTQRGKRGKGRQPFPRSARQDGRDSDWRPCSIRANNSMNHHRPKTPPQATHR